MKGRAGVVKRMQQPEGYRVVIDGIGRRCGTVLSPMMSRDEAMAGFDTAVESFADDLRAGDVRVSVLAEDEFQRRSHADG